MRIRRMDVAKWSLASSAAALLVVLMNTANAHAAEAVDGGSAAASPPVTAQRSASVGAFAPWGMSARSDTQSGIVQLQGGYDGGRGGPLFEQATESRALGRLSVRVGFGWYDDDPGGGPYLGLKLDVLRQEQQGVDLVVAGSYDFDGFNLVPAATLAAAVGAAVGASRLSATLAYGQGLERGERHGQVCPAALRPVASRVHLGLASRLRLDLERDGDEPASEREWDLVAGPNLVLAFGPLALSATGGVSAIKLRAGGPTQVGALVVTGVGTAF
jgi:hypothetical protein